MACDATMTWDRISARTVMRHDVNLWNVSVIQKYTFPVLLFVTKTYKTASQQMLKMSATFSKTSVHPIFLPVGVLSYSALPCQGTHC
jgi:hypothetical protein